QRDREIGQRVAAEYAQCRQNEGGAHPGVHRPRKGVQYRLVDHTAQVLDPLQTGVFTYSVEYHNRVVDRQADNRQDRGQKDTIDRLTPPREHADDGQHDRCERRHRRQRERPPETPGQIQHLGTDRDHERQQCLIAQLLTQAGADQLVADLIDGAELGFERFLDLNRLLITDLAEPDADVVRTAVA